MWPDYLPVTIPVIGFIFLPDPVVKTWFNPFPAAVALGSFVIFPKIRKHLFTLLSRRRSSLREKSRAGGYRLSRERSGEV